MKFRLNFFNFNHLKILKHKYILPEQKTELSSELNTNQNTKSFTYPPFFRLTTSYFPKSESDNSSNFPIGLTIMPGMLGNVPVVDYRNRYVVHCSRCHGYLSSNCIVVPEKNSWICALCGNMTTLPKGYDINNGVETHSPVYDIIINNQLFLPLKEKPFLKMFAISIDTNNAEFCQLFTKSVKKALCHIQDESIVICLFSSDHNVTYYDPVRKKSFVICDFDDLQLPPFQFLPFSETKDYLFRSLDSIMKLSKGVKQEQIKTTSNFRNILKIGQKFLKEFGGVFIISLFSISSDADTPNNDNNPFVIPNDQTDIVDIGFSLNSDSISVHIFHQFDESVQNNHSVVTDTIAGLTNGTSFIINNNHYPIINSTNIVSTANIDKSHLANTNTNSSNNNEISNDKNSFSNNNVINSTDSDIPDDLILDSQLQKILCVKYYWKSICILRTHPEVTRTTYLGNCAVRKNGVCTLCAFPRTCQSSISFELLFPRNPSVLGPLNNIVLQFAIMFTNDEGLQINRIITFPVDIGNETQKITDESRVDHAAVSSFIAKLAVKKLRDTDYASCSNFIKEKEKFCFKSFFDFSSLFMNYDDRMPFKYDVDVSDGVFIYGASVNEIILYLMPRKVKRNSSLWKQTNLAVFVIPDKGKENEVKMEIFGDAENDEKNDFNNFYNECKMFVGWNQPVIFLCD
ncbi:hypothetical protein M9Y10_037208 [Tritrichomonas musculus]|uniref:Zinc finger Sec23/Sec24-type domain-containing protein n=2 Tax=Tritrichomonas musculus TaxID=1915356 RepID=A0ABR2GJC7_9EUKA